MSLRIIRNSLVLMVLVALNAVLQQAQAVGTPAGTDIINSVTVTYSISGVAAPPVTAAVTIRVDEVINVRVTAPAAVTPVNTPDSNRVLAFFVTNIGNGVESYAITSVLNPSGAGIPADQFNPMPGSLGSLFLDVNNDGLLDAGDTAITGPLSFNADEVKRILVVSNIPPALMTGNTGLVQLLATSQTTGAAAANAGTVLANQGGGGAVPAGSIDAVVGVGTLAAADGGSSEFALGTYQVTAVTVTVSKIVFTVTAPAALGGAISDCTVAVPPAGCTVFVPGTVVEYLVTLTVSGSGTAQAVAINDTVPANTTWVVNSIRTATTLPNLALAAANRTDVADGDNASCAGCGIATGAAAVTFGDITVSSTTVTHLVAYKVTIN